MVSNTIRAWNRADRRARPRLVKPRERTLLDRPADARDFIDPFEIGWYMFDFDLDGYDERPDVPRLRVAMGDVMRIL